MSLAMSLAPWMLSLPLAAQPHAGTRPGLRLVGGQIRADYTQGSLLNCTVLSGRHRREDDSDSIRCTSTTRCAYVEKWPSHTRRVVSLPTHAPAPPPVCPPRVLGPPHARGRRVPPPPFPHARPRRLQCARPSASGRPTRDGSRLTYRSSSSLTILPSTSCASSWSARPLNLLPWKASGFSSGSSSCL